MGTKDPDQSRFQFSLFSGFAHIKKALVLSNPAEYTANSPYLH